MGATFSSGNNVAVWCDKADYFSGDVVQGYVLLNITEPIYASTVVIEVKGYERASWEEVTVNLEFVKGKPPAFNPGGYPGGNQGGLGAVVAAATADLGGGLNTGPVCTTHYYPVQQPNGQNKDGYWRNVERRRYCHSKNEFFKVEVPLHHWDASQQLPRGQYQFPFRAALPADLPGSFRFTSPQTDVAGKKHNNVIGKIKYKVKATVLKNSKMLGLMNVTTNLNGSQDIVVRQRLTRPPSELTAETVTSVQTCLCRGQGLVVTRVHASKNAFMAGETAVMVLEIENRTKLEFKIVSVTIERTVRLMASGCSHTATEQVAKQKFPGLPSNTSFVGEGAKQLALPLPAGLVATTVGTLVTCSYTARVEMSAGLLSNNPRLVVPITIYAAPPPHQPYSAQPPADWNPQMIAQVVDVRLPGVAVGVPAAQQHNAAPQQYSPAPQQYNPAPQQYNPAPQQYNPAPQQYNPAPQQYNAAPPQYNAAPQQYGGGPQYDPASKQYAASAPPLGSGPQQYGAAPPQYNAAPPQYNAAPHQQYNAAPQQYNAAPQQYGGGPQYDPASKQYAASAPPLGSGPQQYGAVPAQPALNPMFTGR